MNPYPTNLELKVAAKHAMAAKKPQMFLASLITLGVPFLFIFIVLKTTHFDTAVSYYPYGGYDMYSGMEQYMYRLTPFQILYLVAAIIVIYLLQVLLQYGFTFYCLKLSRGEQTGISDVFSGFFRPGRIILAHLFAGIRVFLWTCLFIFPGIAAQYSYSQIDRVLADDPNISAWAAVDVSRDIMRGSRMRLWMLQLSFFGWLFLSAMLWNIPMLYVEPYMNVTEACFYDAITGGAPRFRRGDQPESDFDRMFR